MADIISIDCPYCMTKDVAVPLHEVEIWDYTQDLPALDGRTKGQALGRCMRCKCFMVVLFGETEAESSEQAVSFRSRWYPVKGTLPRLPTPDIPEHIPENVERSFLGAEKALLAGLFTEAANSYGKAIDRAITPFLGDQVKPRDTLGMKIGKLRTAGQLPAALSDWMDVVVKDRNFAAHDDDLDFESAAEVATIRDFARILLTYLYTMPKRVELAREAAAARKAD